MRDAIRPYAMHAFLLAFTVAMLVSDGILGGLGPQLALGVVAFGVLWAFSHRVEGLQRVQLWLCVPISTGFEALEDSVALDVFSPVREDWVRGDDAYLRR